MKYCFLLLFISVVGCSVEVPSNDRHSSFNLTVVPVPKLSLAENQTANLKGQTSHLNDWKTNRKIQGSLGNTPSAHAINSQVDLYSMKKMILKAKFKTLGN